MINCYFELVVTKTIKDQIVELSVTNLNRAWVITLNVSLACIKQLIFSIKSQWSIHLLSHIKFIPQLYKIWIGWYVFDESSLSFCFPYWFNGSFLLLTIVWLIFFVIIALFCSPINIYDNLWENNKKIDIKSKPLMSINQYTRSTRSTPPFTV